MGENKNLCVFAWVCEKSKQRKTFVWMPARRREGRDRGGEANIETEQNKQTDRKTHKNTKWEALAVE